MAIDLNSIRKTTDDRPPMVTIYGTSGVGKTTACAIKDSVWIQTEQGEGMLELNAFPLAKSLQDVLDAVQSLIEHESDYNLLVIDSLDHLEPLIWDQLCVENKWPNIESAGYGKGYTVAVSLWRVLLTKLDELRTKRKIAIALIAHSHLRKELNGEHGDIDKYDLKINKKASSLIVETCDAVFFAKHEIVVRKEEKNFGGSRLKGTATGNRIMATAETPHFVAKNRFNLPEEIPLDWMAFAKAKKAAKAKLNQPKKEA
jgi:hypothetical protein|tara:strand:+ start:113 stop:886 length:774 start_codon:yes stop_codon:yes gene_type:complete